MYILGLGGSNHDFSACLVKDGEIRCMIEDERITRKKNGKGLGLQLAKGFSLNYCLKAEGIDIDQVDMIVANDIINKVMYKRLNKKVEMMNHHLAHAASSYYVSQMNEAAILVLDAVGSKNLQNNKYESGSYGVGTGREIRFLGKVEGYNYPETDYVENSLGIFYSIITEIIGFGEHQEGKTMGLAPYGTSKYYHLIKRYIRYTGKGQIEMKMEDIKALLELKKMVAEVKGEEKQFELKADFAWAAQTILEELIMDMCRYVKVETKMDNICLAGGIGLNSVANYKLYKEKLFKNIFIPPACGDNGTSIGSALYGYHCLQGNIG